MLISLEYMCKDAIADFYGKCMFDLLERLCHFIFSPALSQRSRFSIWSTIFGIATIFYFSCYIIV